MNVEKDLTGRGLEEYLGINGNRRQYYHRSQGEKGFPKGMVKFCGNKDDEGKKILVLFSAVEVFGRVRSCNFNGGFMEVVRDLLRLN